MIKNLQYRGVAQLVERVVWDHQAAGSSPVTPTKLTSPIIYIRTRSINIRNLDAIQEESVYAFLRVV